MMTASRAVSSVGLTTVSDKTARVNAELRAPRHRRDASRCIVGVTCEYRSERDRDAGVPSISETTWGGRRAERDRRRGVPQIVKADPGRPARSARPDTPSAASTQRPARRRCREHEVMIAPRGPSRETLRGLEDAVAGGAPRSRERSAGCDDASRDVLGSGKRRSSLERSERRRSWISAALEVDVAPTAARGSPDRRIPV